jgi:hypothetical protein
VLAFFPEEASPEIVIDAQHQTLYIAVRTKAGVSEQVESLVDGRAIV